MPDYFSGLDLGQQRDYTALTIIERQDAPEGTKRSFIIKHLHRWPLGTSYPTIVSDVVSLMAKAPLPGSYLCIDATGVGRPIVDLFRQARPPVRIVPITITGGSESTPDGQGGFHVSKCDLAGAAIALVQSDRLKAVPSLPLVPTLLKEMSTFRYKVTAAGNETLEAWRERDHDDLCFATMMPLWYAERQYREVFMMILDTGSGASHRREPNRFGWQGRR
jgi:hypothetical protein